MFKQVKLIIWKHFKIRQRHWFLTLLEILIPILLFTAFSYGRSRLPGLKKTEIVDPVYYPVQTERDFNRQISHESLIILYAPSTDFTDTIILNIQRRFKLSGESVKSFQSEPKLNEYYTNYNLEDRLYVAIIFNGNDTKKLNYDLRIYEEHLVWKTDRLYRTTTQLANRPMDASSKYIYKGFVALQLAINKAFLDLSLKSKKLNVTFTLQQFPSPPHTEDSELNIIFHNYLPLITIFGLIFVILSLLKSSMDEKYSGVNQLMKISGLNTGAIWVGWFSHSLITSFLSIIVITILMKVNLWGVQYPPIEFCSSTILFTFLFLYCLSSIAYCFVISSVFVKPSLGMILGTLIWIFSCIIPNVLLSSYETYPLKYNIMLGFIPNIALQYGYEAIFVYETREIGIQWSNFYVSGSGDEDEISMLYVFTFFLVDILFFFLTAIYLDNVHPGKYGVGKSYLFPAQFIAKKIFRIKKAKNIPELTELRTLRTYVEPGEGQKHCIEILSLSKHFHTSNALENISLDLYENHITVFLGENGAGKTTLMSIISGMIRPSSGSIKFCNDDKPNSVENKKLGFCPQENLLFSMFTVKEHLQFFSMLKGQSSKDVRSEVNKIMEDLGLEDKKHYFPNQLSGGMRRKVCLGIALVGDSKILVLDEPSSGLDYEIRHEMWNILKKLKEDRTILLTTHFMDEADALADWIAILYKGRLQSYGTRNFFRYKYNIGYCLSIALNHEYYASEVNHIVQDTFQDAKIIKQNGPYMAFNLPITSEKLSEYQLLLENLEDCDFVNHIGLTLSTLDDIFLKAKKEADADRGEDKYYPALEPNLKKLKETPLRLNLFCQFKSLFLKRWYFFKRKWFQSVPTVIVSFLIFLTILINIGSNTNYYEIDGPPLPINLNHYGKSPVYYSGPNYNATHYYKNIVAQQNGNPVRTENVLMNIIDEGVNNIAYYKRHMIVATEFRGESDRHMQINCLYSAEALHSVPISINLATNAVVKALLGDSYSITVTNNPLRRGNLEPSSSLLSEEEVAALCFILLPLGFAFLISDFIIFSNFEIPNNFINLQFMSGVSTLIYWLCNIIVDYVLLILKSSLIVALLATINYTTYNYFGFEELGAFLAIFYSYSFATMPFAYLFAYKKSLVAGFSLLFAVIIFSGWVLTPLLIVSDLTSGDKSLFAYFYKFIIIPIFPSIGMTYMSVKFARKFVQNYNWINMSSLDKKELCTAIPDHPCCNNREDSAFCLKFKSYFMNKEFGISKDIFFTLSAFILYLLILYLIEAKLVKLKCMWSKVNKRRGVNNNNNVLVAENLNKSFGRHHIVKNFSVEVEKGKCVGVLGANGAGKTTILRILAHDITPDKGTINLIVNEKTINVNSNEYSLKIGYCPQTDVLNLALSGRELLTTMALMKGHTNSKELVDSLLELFDLTIHADKPCGHYSGGNKRKLNTAMAFLGRPSVIFLDEATNGVDPSARRKFWLVLKHIKYYNETAFVLCSHSMEETEALSDKIAIIKDGAVEVQGILSELKSKYQKGIFIQLMLGKIFLHDDVQNELRNDLHNIFKIDENRGKKRLEMKLGPQNVLQCFVTDSGRKLSSIFNALNKLRNKYCIENFTVSDAKLDHIFLLISESMTSTMTA